MLTLSAFTSLFYNISSSVIENASPFASKASAQSVEALKFGAIFLGSAYTTSSDYIAENNLELRLIIPLALTAVAVPLGVNSVIGVLQNDMNVSGPKGFIIGFTSAIACVGGIGAYIGNGPSEERTAIVTTALVTAFATAIFNAVSKGNQVIHLRNVHQHPRIGGY